MLTTSIEPNLKFLHEIMFLANAHDASSLIVSAIIKSGADTLYSHYIDEKMPQFTTNKYIIDIYEVLEKMMPNYDRGENLEDIEKEWAFDSEPSPSIVDPWAKNSITKTEMLKPICNNLMLPKRDIVGFLTQKEIEKPDNLEFKEFEIKQSIKEDIPIVNPKEKKMREDKVEKEKNAKQRKEEDMKRTVPVPVRGKKQPMTHDIKGKLIPIKKIREDQIGNGIIHEVPTQVRKDGLRSVKTPRTEGQVLLNEIDRELVQPRPKIRPQSIVFDYKKSPPLDDVVALNGGTVFRFESRVKSGVPIVGGMNLIEYEKSKQRLIENPIQFSKHEDVIVVPQEVNVRKLSSFLIPSQQIKAFQQINDEEIQELIDSTVQDQQVKEEQKRLHEKQKQQYILRKQKSEFLKKEDQVLNRIETFNGGSSAKIGQAKRPFLTEYQMAVKKLNLELVSGHEVQPEYFFPKEHVLSIDPKAASSVKILPKMKNRLL